MITAPNSYYSAQEVRVRAYEPKYIFSIFDHIFQNGVHGGGGVYTNCHYSPGTGGAPDRIVVDAGNPASASWVSANIQDPVAYYLATAIPTWTLSGAEYTVTLQYRTATSAAGLSSASWISMTAGTSYLLNEWYQLWFAFTKVTNGSPYLTNIQLQGSFTFADQDVHPDSSQLSYEAPTDFSDMVSGQHTLRLFDKDERFNPRSSSFIFSQETGWYYKGLRVDFGFVRPGTNGITVDSFVAFEGKILGWKRDDTSKEIPIVEVSSKDYLATLLTSPLGTGDDYGLKSPVLYGKPLISAEDTKDTIPLRTIDAVKSGVFDGVDNWDSTLISPADSGTVTREADTAARLISPYRTGAGTGAGTSARTKTSDPPVANSAVYWQWDLGSGIEDAWFEGWVRFNDFPTVPVAKNTFFAHLQGDGVSYVKLAVDSDTRLWVVSKLGAGAPIWHNTDVFVGAYRQAWVKIAFCWFTTGTKDGIVRVFFDGEEAWTNSGDWHGITVRYARFGPQVGDSAEYWDLSWKHVYAWTGIPSPLYYRAESYGNGGIESIWQVLQDGVIITSAAHKRTKRQRALDRKLQFTFKKFHWSCKDNWLAVPNVGWAISWTDYYNPPSGEMIFQVIANSTVGRNPVDIITDLLTTHAGLGSRIDSASFTAARPPTLSLPTAPTINQQHNLLGFNYVTPGTHSVKVVYITKLGQTLPGPASSSINVTYTDGTIYVQNISCSSSPEVIARAIYMTVAGNTGDWKYVFTIPDNTTTTYTISKLDGALGVAAPTLDTSSYYAINCNFSDTTVAEAIKTITSGLLINARCEQGVFKLSLPYDGTPPTSPVISLDSSMLKASPVDINYEDCTPKITAHWGWYDKNPDLQYIARDQAMIDQLGQNEETLDLTFSSPVALDSENGVFATAITDNLLKRAGSPPDKIEVEGWFDYLPRLQLWDTVSRDGVNFQVYSKSMGLETTRIGLVRFLGE